MPAGQLFCDGGARGNPGPAGAAAILYGVRGEEIDSASAFLGDTTNNVAEYQGVLLGLDLARKHRLRDILIHLDSELVVRQLLGTYKVRHPGLRPLWEKSRWLLTAFGHWEVRHIPREENSAADRLVNLVLDQRA